MFKSCWCVLWFALGCLVQGLQVATGFGCDDPAPAPKSAPRMVRISGPHSHANLTFFLLHGESNLKERKFISLGAAMEQQKIIVHETSTVNTLLVENISDDCEVFIQSGDIVKGGRQDRLMATDMIVPAKSGKIPIPSFCVESGRWQGRGQEDVEKFSANAFQGGKGVKLAANQARSQQEVWNKVQETQSRLSKTVNRDVASAQSPSSYQLTMEDRELAAKLAEYETRLAGIVQANDVIGIAYAINGKLEGAEVYGSPILLATQWKKVLHSCATDALAAKTAGSTREPVSRAAVESFLSQANGTLTELKPEAANQARQHASRGDISQAPNQSESAQVQSLNRLPNLQQQVVEPIPAVDLPASEASSSQPTIRIYQCDTPATLLIESRDMDGTGNVIHRSYLRKETQDE